jgi:hypothetical protein
MKGKFHKFVKDDRAGTGSRVARPGETASVRFAVRIPKGKSSSVSLARR